MATLPWLLEETWENLKRDEQQRFVEEEGAPPTTLSLCVNKVTKMSHNLLFELRCQISQLYSQPERAVCLEFNIFFAVIESLFVPGISVKVQSVNEKQQQVIDEATSMVCDGSAGDSKVYMIQGPPGTGKSHTITNIIQSIAQIIFTDGLNIIRMGRDESLSTPNESRLQQISLETIAEQICSGDSSLSQRERAKRAAELKQRLIKEADVVVCTLNYCGNSQFDPYCLTRQSQHPSFDCLIVDEACQCLEIDVFIPLRLGIRRVLLVGDPEQLPPTVICNRALNAKFGQSLMERLYSLFKSNNLIRMLNIEIIIQYFLRSASFRLKPYVFINVPNSSATWSQVSQSYLNRSEADCIAHLYRFLTQKVSIDRQSIGIITPYKQQVELIKDQLKSQIDIGTVDGFQGREKDIILLSTVRAHSEKQKRPTIGFVADRRRLNVALTRAKYGMYIIGHLNSLSINRDWHALIQDAEERGCILNYSPRGSFNWLKKI
ncbi:unnamed protein product [Adineta steineri]|uniref:Uncharacterized protein n=1 Tax=Adineta steineri TaxID=433720 RepID=A0A813WZW1_9BILA|nr:unnamed protein product [Adineta steineri]CAF3856461.1 unnamed protein product [Adineta steineri]